MYKRLNSSLFFAAAAWLLFSGVSYGQEAAGQKPSAPSPTATTSSEATPAETPLAPVKSASESAAPTSTEPATTSPDTPKANPAEPSTDSATPTETPASAPANSLSPAKTAEANKPHFSLLRSDNPADYQRTQGIWISDTGNGRIIYMKNMAGQDFYALGLSGSGLGRFLNPEQIWVDMKGHIYVADRGNNRVVYMDDIRGYNWQEMKGFSEPQGVAAHGKRIFVADTGNDRILVYDKFGAETPMATLQDEKIKKPGYLWLDMDGNLFVSCGEFPPGGQVVRIPYNLTTPANEWKVYTGRGLQGNSFAPSQVSQSEQGFYIVDSVTQRIVRLDNFKGRNPWQLGTYGHESFQFVDPKGISQDEEGRIFVADTGNDRIVCIDTIKGKNWETYGTAEPSFGLRSPRSVYVWSPRPEPEEEEEEADKDKDANDKDKSSTSESDKK